MIRATAVSAADRALVAAFSLFYVISLARILPKEQYGYAVLFDAVRNFALLFVVGMGQGMVKYGAGNEDELPTVAGSSLLLQGGVWLVLSVLLLLGADPISRALGAPDTRGLLLLLPALLAVMAPYATASAAALSGRRYGVVVLLDGVHVAAFVGSLLALHALGKLDTARDAVWILLASRTACATVALVFLSRARRLSLPTVAWVSRLWRYGRASMINQVGAFGASRADVFLVGAFAGPLAAASYGAALVSLMAFMLGSEVMNMVVLPRAAAVHNSMGPAAANQLKRMFVASGYSLLLPFLPVSALMVFCPELLSKLLYGDRYPEAATLLRMLSAWGLALPFIRAASTILNAAERPAWNARVTWLLVVVSMAGNALLVRRYGVYGAGGTSVVVAIVALAAYGALMRKVFGLGIGDLVAPLRSTARPSADA